MTRQSDGIEPTQHAELGIGLAQAVEDHGANHGERIEAAIGRPQRPRHSTLQTQLLPERVQGVDIAERLGADELDVGNRRGYPTESPLQTADQRFEVLRTQLVESAQVGDDPLSGFPVVITEGLDELQVSPPAGLGDARKHAATVAAVGVDIKT